MPIQLSQPLTEAPVALLDADDVINFTEARTGPIAAGTANIWGHEHYGDQWRDTVGSDFQGRHLTAVIRDRVAELGGSVTPADLAEVAQLDLQRVLYEFRTNPMPPPEGTREALIAIADTKVQMFLASRSEPERLEIYVQNLRLEDMFPPERRMHLAAGNKYAIATAELGLNGQKRFVLEDSDHAIADAISAGCDLVVGTLCCKPGEEHTRRALDMFAAGAHFVVPTNRDLVTLWHMIQGMEREPQGMAGAAERFGAKFWGWDPATMKPLSPDGK
jgi:beta-phosphoglucomutase-like phosphatase (HAD superfamily)